tara:strand:- start:235 stop:444 length:210 start_codon:yes stop_codon:yes gene_type:complete
MNLTDAEWREIVSLDYVLTWRYTDDYEKDLKRYKELSKKRWCDCKLERHERAKMELDYNKCMDCKKEIQ